MKTTSLKSINIIDIIFILGVSIFFLSCIASSYHIAKTLEPGQGSLSTGYMQARSLEDLTAEPVQLIGFNSRIGVSKGFDMGAEYTLDISKENDNAFATIWGDCKIQLTNRDNKLFKPIISTGLLKGYVYDEEARIHVSSLPILMSIQANDRIAFTAMYRYELFSEGFMPRSYSFEDPRHALALGLEYSLSKPVYNKWSPKLAFSIGTLNSLQGGEGDNVFTFNFGLIFNSPYKPGGTNLNVD
jgi:hypothetical protein